MAAQGTQSAGHGTNELFGDLDRMKNRTTVALGALLAAMLGGMVVTPSGHADGFNPMNMMNPSKWMGGKNNRDDHYDDYGAPGYGGYGAPGYGGYGTPGYGYGAPGYGYGAPQQGQGQSAPVIQ